MALSHRRAAQNACQVASTDRSQAQEKIMKKTLAAGIALLAMCAMSAAWAGGPDLGPGEGFDNKFDAKELMTANEFSARNTEIAAIVKSAKRFDENVAIVNQTSDGEHEVFAYISQSGGHGNLAAISQDGRQQSAVALVFQSGSNARAIINQR
jgi:hypothetical protein